jgi:hypothetical protein
MPDLDAELFVAAGPVDKRRCTVDGEACTEAPSFPGGKCNSSSSSAGARPGAKDLVDRCCPEDRPGQRRFFADAADAIFRNHLQGHLMEKKENAEEICW